MHPLPEDHPGFSDPAYRQRRAAIASIGEHHRPGDPLPDVTYTAEEDELWRLVSCELAVKHARSACAQYLAAADRLCLPHDRVPQLSEVSAGIEACTGFRIEPVAGLVPIRRFYRALAERRFLSTQYVRHHSVPFYTPEPDLVHEIIGHANMLASPVFADLYQAAGRAAQRAQSDAALELFSKVFWFTLEFGVVWEDGTLKAYGAGLLSSYGEIDVFPDADIRRWDLRAMGTTEYDISTYLPVLFAAESFAAMVDALAGFFDCFDDNHYLSLVRTSTTAG